MFDKSTARFTFEFDVAFDVTFDVAFDVIFDVAFDVTFDVTFAFDVEFAFGGEEFSGVIGIGIGTEFFNSDAKHIVNLRDSS